MVSLTVDALRRFQDVFGAVFPAVFALFAPFRNYEDMTYRYLGGRLVDWFADDLLRDQALRVPLHRFL
jgi:hypothetical protein